MVDEGQCHESFKRDTGGERKLYRLKALAHRGTSSQEHNVHPHVC